MNMFCSACGVEAGGNFCSLCGADLDLSSAEPINADNPLPAGDWANQKCLDELLELPEVRALITQHMEQAHVPLSAEAFLKACDIAMKPLTGVSLSKLSSVVQPFYARIGIRTGKQQQRIIKAPPGRTLVALLCSLARHGQKLCRVIWDKEGCLLEASLPSDVWSYEGRLIISIHWVGREAVVEAATNIKGQLFDWGKSKRCLEELFTDLNRLPAMA